jgi:hypothetical protein
MTRFGVGLASVLMCAILAAPADAPAAGNGLYSPFPTVAARKRAERFVNRLRAPRAQRPVSRAELDHGSFTGHARTAVASGGATARASDAGGVAAASVWIVMVVLAAACASPAARRRRSA